MGNRGQLWVVDNSKLPSIDGGSMVPTFPCGNGNLLALELKLGIPRDRTQQW